MLLAHAVVFTAVAGLALAIARADPVTGLELTYYAMFMAVLMRALLDLAFGGDWGEDLGILTGLWLAVVLNGMNPLHALIGPISWFVGGHVIPITP